MNNIKERIAQLSAQTLAHEEKVEGQTIRLIDIVRENYESWSRIVAEREKRNLRKYDSLVELLANPSIGISTTSDTLRATFSALKLQRGERTFKKNGEPFSNKQWDGKSVTRGSGLADRGRYSRSQAVVLPEVPTARIEAPALGRQSPGVRLPPTVEVSQAVPAPGEKFTVSWSFDGAHPVFQGMEFPVRSGKMVDKLRALESLIAEVAFRGNEDDCRAARTFLTGYMKKLGYDSYGEDKVEAMDWPQLAQNALGRLQARI
jgi:hypothetical protein